MKPTVTLDQVKRVLRSRVCADCPYRTPGTDSQSPDRPRGCESSCRLFMHLPVLREVARQVDPMVGNRKRALSNLLTQFHGGEGTSRPALRHYRHKVVKTLEGLFHQ
jgi:hypothetical protein